MRTALLLFVCACAQKPMVRHWGEVHAIMHDGKTQANVRLAELDTKNLFAVGALSGLRGEVTIIGGESWLAYPDRIDRGVLDESATLLVAANVSSWKDMTIDADLSEAQLEDWLGTRTDKPAPVRINGTITDVKWHIITPAGHSGKITSERAKIDNAMLVGFYSTQHEGVFTHMGRSTHFHIVAAGLSGHVDAVTLKAGNVISLPR